MNCNMTLKKTGLGIIKQTNSQGEEGWVELRRQRFESICSVLDMK